MPPKCIHQISAGYTNGDAISNEAREMRALFRSWGFQSEIFSETKSVLPGLRSDCLDVSELASRVNPSDTVLLHFSIGSAVNEQLAGLPCRKILRYHNITPHHYFTPINAATAACLRKGRQQIEALAGVAEVNIAVSEYNAGELRKNGYSNVTVLPIMIDTNVLQVAPDRKLTKELSETGTNILFVGRCAPNKRIEDLVNAFYHYHKFCNKDSTLIHVGSFSGTERYHYLIKGLVKDLGLTERVRFMGSIPQTELNACYKSSDLFLSMSEHEGFCIPVIEAMYHGLPVMAFAAAAVPDTMDGAGVLFGEKDYPMVAETMHHILSSDSLRNSILSTERARIDRYFSRDHETELRAMILPS